MDFAPDYVLGRLGPTPHDLTRLGSSRVLKGNGLMLKGGPPDRASREAFAVGLVMGTGLVKVPRIVDSGLGWVLLEAIEARPWQIGPEPLSALAPLHESFEGAAALEDARLRDVLGGELSDLLVTARSAEPDLPEPLSSLLGNPEPLLEVIADEPRTLVHGDAWPGNVLDTSGGPTWLDWEEAGVAPAAYDLAVWLNGSPWVPASADPSRDLEAYVSARTTLRIEQLERAVDALTVLVFLALDVAHLTEGVPEFTDGIIERRNDAALRVLA